MISPKNQNQSYMIIDNTCYLCKTMTLDKIFSILNYKDLFKFLHNIIYCPQLLECFLLAQTKYFKISKCYMLSHVHGKFNLKFKFF